MRLHRSIPAALVMAALLPFHAIAGTTGGITGRVVDSQTQAPVAGVTVTVNAPSQTATSVSDATGTFRFLTLVPDTYTISFTKDGYDPVTQPGLSVFADQVQTYNLTMVKTLRQIARVSSRAATNLLKPGTTSDVYSVNASGQQAAQGLTGAGSLNNAYGAIASVPGTNLDQGEQGWFQTLHIRGGDFDQVGYELDGIPVNRSYDNAPESMLSSLGSQEVQVYTGGVPAGSDAQGISGYVNQVVKTGTYPGYAQASLGVGYPSFYHQASIEVGGSTPDRLFSYYAGFGGSNQGFNYINGSNGANIPNSFFYPVNATPGSNGFVYTGPPGPGLFTSGLAFGLISQSLRDNIINLHFGIPHHNSSLKDDVQLMWVNSENLNTYYSSTDDIGLSTIGYAPTWDDTYAYTGAPMTPVDPTKEVQYFFPGSAPHPWQGLLPTALRDPNDNGVSVEKVQFQHAFSPSEFLRVEGYSLYSNWFINGYNSTAQPYYGWELPYFLPDHAHGISLLYENQLNSQHLLTVTGSYKYSNMSRWDVTYFPTGWNLTSYVGKNGLCYGPDGQQTGCYAAEQGTTGDPTDPNFGMPYTVNCGGASPPPSCKAGAQWLVTDTSFKGSLNEVNTSPYGYSIGDQWRPNDQWNVNIGARMEDFQYIFGSTQPNDAARQFWFNAYNREFCFGAGVNNNQPIMRDGGGLGSCPKGTSAVHLYNTSGGGYTVARFQPRVGLTFTVDPNSVLRASFGIYARPPNASWTQYNRLEQNLPAFLGAHFYGYGFNTPEHIIRPDTSYNYDVSWEHRLKGTDISFKVSPFFRATRDQLQNFFIDPQGGLESGLNVGNQQTSGVEFALQKGDFNRDGLSGQLSLTYTHSMIRYNNFSNTTQNVIDQLNTYIEQYDEFTKHGYNGVHGSPCYFTTNHGGGGTNNCSQAGVVSNPYYNQPYQNLLDRNAWYTTYDVIPGPVSGENGYATPWTGALILNYKHQRFSITNSWSFASGASYGAPASWPGYYPNACGYTSASWRAGHGIAADPARCGVGALPLFIPDPYTGVFDNLGAFKQPWRLQMGISTSYEISPRVTARLSFINILDVCGQRGYAWSNPDVCVYSGPPTGFFYPAGNFYPNHSSAVPPAQMQYPYDFWFNGNNTGFLGVDEPLQVTGSLQIRI